MKKSLPYKEGTWFAVPLRSGGYGLGIVARLKGDGIAFGYFFGPRRDFVPTITEIEELSKDKSVLKIQFGDLGLLNGEWRVIGHHEDFDRSDWPLPPFIRVDDISGKAWREVYSDSLEMISDDPCDPLLVKDWPRSVLAGYGAVEKRLTRLLVTENSSHS
jgi:hypothetical protein